MGKKQGSAARRAKKKHQKELKRRKERTKKGPGVAPPALRGGVPLSSLVARRSTWDPRREGIEGLMTAEALKSYYEAALLVDDPECPEDISIRARDLWTPSRVAAMQTDEITERLGELGAGTDEGTFLAERQAFRSAVSLARALWLPRLPATADALARDFVCLAACELWKRWCPSSPPEEMLVEALLAGYLDLEDGEEVAAVRHWLDVWAGLKPSLTPDMRTLDAAEHLLGDFSTTLPVWVEDFAVSACVAAVDEPELQPRLTSALEEILAQFSGETWERRAALEGDLATILWEGGERERAEGLLRRQIEEHPESAAGYVSLASLWAPSGYQDREAIQRALALLEQATSHPVNDADDFDLRARIHDQRKALKKA